ncbi:MAG TPA: NADH-quinone oxidoreductase subunit NuoG, partial [Nevskiaceae bacterium]|nr:NADH-quinone oxidoreductase subunit NuoG [Nevskiaceae bacterium]
FREAIIEYMMTSHPHDCPVCEEGGHCHLQDMTVMTGHHSRRYRFNKRTHLNQELGPFVAHEMNRCISCYRCVRYYKDYAGGTDLDVFGAAANVYFGRAQEGTLESEFSGNLTEVCPTGVFTDKTHSERYVRKWDMQFAPSICSGCAVGCNVSPGERYGEIRRIENRYHGHLNGYFLCDRGRFGYGFVNRKDRPHHGHLKLGGPAPHPQQAASMPPVTADQAVDAAREMLKKATRVIGIGSPRASVEANFALSMLVGAENFFNGMSAQDHDLVNAALKVVRDGNVPTATIKSMEEADAVLVLGEDPTQTAPRFALAIRQAARGKMASAGAKKNIPDWQVIALADLVQREKNPIFVAAPTSTRLDDIAAATYHGAPEDLARFGFAIARAIDSKAPSVKGFDKEAGKQVEQIAAALKAAKKALIVSGTGSGSAAVMQAAANVAMALKTAGVAVEIALSIPEANSFGVAVMNAKSGADALKELADGKADAVVILENDLYRRAPTSEVDAALAKAGGIVVVDHQKTATSEKAHVVLPAGTVFEGDGTYVNYEGRAQRWFQVFDPAYYDRSIVIRESWRWLDGLGADRWRNLDDVTGDCASALPQLAQIVDAAPDASFRVKGLKLARMPARASGRTAQRANISVHEPRATQDPDSPLNFSMEGYSGVGSQDRPPELLPFAWSPGWNSPQAWNKFQHEVGGELRGGDPGKLIFKANAEAKADYFDEIPAAFKPAKDGLRVLPLHQIFGSEEQSARATPIQKRMSAAFVAVNADDAAKLGLNGKAAVEVDGTRIDLAVRRTDLPQGVIGLPEGFAGIPFLDAQSTAKVSKA